MNKVRCAKLMAGVFLSAHLAGCFFWFVKVPRPLSPESLQHSWGPRAISLLHARASVRRRADGPALTCEARAHARFVGGVCACVWGGCSCACVRGNVCV